MSKRTEQPAVAEVMPQQPGSGQTVKVRQDLAEEITISQGQEMAAAATQAKAEVETRILTAKRWPRDLDQFRLDILNTCRRPGFAEIALYHKPVGRKQNAEGQWENAFASGFSIRFIEAALQQYGNVYVSSHTEWETQDQLKLVVSVMDIQHNTGFSMGVIIDKLIERKEVKKGRKTRGMRENSYGDLVYLLDATKDEVRNLVGAERSKLMRDNGLRLLPRDVLDECWAQVEGTINDENARDPDSAKKKILDRFAALGVSATALKEYLGKPLEALTQKEINDLAPLHNGLKEGDFTWADVMRVKADPEGAKATVPQTLHDRIMQQASLAGTTPAETKQG
jgi:hypothetical protein